MNFHNISSYEKTVTANRYCVVCQSEQFVKLVRDITKSGVAQVYWFCNKHKDATNPKNRNIPHEKIKALSIIIDKLPVINNYSNGDYNVCVVCGSIGTEEHHWAPKYLFEDAEMWPKSELCQTCHNLWHNIVTPNMKNKTK